MLAAFSRLKCGMIIAVTSALLVLGACSSGGGDGPIQYANSYAGAYETDATFRFFAQTINFTISWNENNGTISGIYQDDYFATSSVMITGTISDAGTSFVVKLAKEVDGVASLDFVVTNTTSGSVASVTGKSSSGATVFADSDIVLEKKSAGSSGTGDLTTVEGFFAALAGEHSWVASRSGSADTQWTADETYKITITTDKKIVLPSNDGDVSIAFGENAEDKFEAHDHESYMVATRGACRWLLQKQKDKDPFLTCTKGNEINSPFWKFAPKGGTSGGVLAEYGLEAFAGDYAWVVLTAHGADDIVYSRGAELKFTIGDDGKVTTELGDFPYDSAKFYQYDSTVNGVSSRVSTWYSPNKTDVPRKEFKLNTNDEGIVSVEIRDVRSQTVSVYYTIGKSLF